MTDILIDLYPWTKTLHIISVITWMAGLFYLPRLYVYHVESVETKSQTDALFQTMERKLYHYIMRPSLISTWLFGLLLVMTPGIVTWSDIWPWAKFASVVGMTWFHLWLGARRLEFVAGENTRSGRDFRIMNEVPTVLLIVIIVAVVVRPF